MWLVLGRQDASLDGHSSATGQKKSATAFSEHLDLQTDQVGCIFVAVCCPSLSTVGKGRDQTGTQGCRLGGITMTVVFTWHIRQAIAMSDTGGDRWLGRYFFSWSDIHSKWQLKSLVPLSTMLPKQSNAWPLASEVVFVADVDKKECRPQYLSTTV